MQKDRFVSDRALSDRVHLRISYARNWPAITISAALRRLEVSLPRTNSCQSLTNLESNSVEKVLAFFDLRRLGFNGFNLRCRADKTIPSLPDLRSSVQNPVAECERDGALNLVDPVGMQFRSRSGSVASLIYLFLGYLVNHSAGSPWKCQLRFLHYYAAGIYYW